MTVAPDDNSQPTQLINIQNPIIYFYILMIFFTSLTKFIAIFAGFIFVIFMILDVLQCHLYHFFVLQAGSDNNLPKIHVYFL